MILAWNAPDYTLISNEVRQDKIMKKLISVLFLLILVYFLLGFYDELQISNYSYWNTDLPKEFDDYRIVFISDLHCKEVGKEQYKLIQAIASCNPDMVVFTGDMIDGSHKDLSPIKDLLAGLSGKYPMYAVTGNHERDNLLKYEELLKYYEEYGVYFLDNDHLTISREGAHLGIYGISYRDRYYIKKGIKTPNKNINNFNILLYHDATVFSEISLYGYNLVLSGHTHGGIIRLPFLGGVINNDGTLFPEFDGGMFSMNGSSMIVNRGVGDSEFPRFYNRPELVCITLKTGNN